MMRRLTFITLLSFCLFVNFAYSQKSAEPRLVGTWKLGYEDYDEFIFHRVEEFVFSYLKENPNAKMVVRLCSGDKIAVALARTDGTVFTFPEHAKNLQVPADRVFFARWSRCERKTEQYWFVPGEADIEYDELVPADRVRIDRLRVGYDANPVSRSAKREFAENLQKFIAALKNNPKATGFIVHSRGMKSRYLKEVLRHLGEEKIDEDRFQILNKRIYRSHYPELLVVTITE